MAKKERKVEAGMKLLFRKDGRFLRAVDQDGIEQRDMKKKKGSWIVRVKCTVLKNVYVSNCTEEQARIVPFEHADDELELEQIDWEVKQVIENENLHDLRSI